MIYIRENTPEKLVIESPRTVNRMIGIGFFIIGGLVAFSIATDSHTENPATRYMAVVPGLISILGLGFLFKGTEADRLVIDKNRQRVSILIHSKTFGKEEPVVLNFNDIDETTLSGGSAGGFGDGSMQSVSVKGVNFKLKDGSTVQATLSVSRKKAAEKAYEAVKEALGR